MSQPSWGQAPLPIPRQNAGQEETSTQQQFPARAADDDVPWAQQTTSQDRITNRARRMVRDLPSWDPLPPGEVFVHRHRRD